MTLDVKDAVPNRAAGASQRTWEDLRGLFLGVGVEEKAEMGTELTQKQMSAPVLSTDHEQAPANHFA